MQKFVNLTTSTREKAIRIGNNVPSGAIGLAWYTAKEILPKNNIVTVDLSETIQENRSPYTKNDNEGFMAFADELGFLRTIDGNYTFSSDDVSISNLFMNKISSTELQEVANLNPNDFVHYYYISNNFIMAPYVFSFISITQYEDQEKFQDIKMKVVDQNGLDYVDPNTGRRKYRLLLEPFKTPVNGRRLEIPYRIVVLLDSTVPPNDLRLMYDKVECDDSGNSFHLEIGYTETVNAVKLYEEIPEESFVIDNNYRDDRKFSVKKINQKFSDVLVRQESDNGYQIISPSKAIDDYRTFEVYNWRMIARTKQSIALNEIEELEANAAVITKTIRCAVLYSSKAQEVNSSISPYIFYRLQDSPFNMAQYDYLNPAASEALMKSNASYWEIDIDGDALNNQNFDIVAWCPTTRITTDQATKIRNFIAKSGTIILDLSNGVDASALNISVDRVVVKANTETVNQTNVLLDSSKNGGWSIVPGTAGGIFEKDDYGIYGTRYSVPLGTYKSYYTLRNIDANYNLTQIGPTVGAQKCIAAIIPYVPNTTEIVKGNIIATTFPIMAYCNAIYSLSTSDQIVDLNVAETANQTTQSIYSGVVEGPFRLLYNAVTYAAYCRISASTVRKTNSTVFNFVSDWQSGWVMNQDVLLDDEKKKYFKIIPGTEQLGLDLTPSADSIVGEYKKLYSDFLPEHQKDKTLGIDDLSVYLEIFIEITNPDVSVSNTTTVDTGTLSADAVSNLVLDELPSAYNLFKVVNPKSKCFTYTTKASPSLGIPENIGPYAIIDKNVSTSNQKSLVNNLNILNSFKSYPFSLQSAYSYMSGTDKPLNLQADVGLTFDMVFKGTYLRKTVTYTKPTAGTATTTLVKTTMNCENFRSAIDSFDANDNIYSSKNPLNTFQYTGDIDIHRNPKLWDIPDVHEYVKYIQYTVAVATGRSVKVDGVYGGQTKSAVYAFQVSGNQIYLDGNVDSETKSYLGFFWKRMKATNPTKFANTLAWAEGNPSTAAAGKYIRAAVGIGSVTDIGTKSYKKVTFSGFRGPNEAKDIIYFKIPDKIKKIDTITIVADASATWQNWYSDIFGYSATFQSDIFKTTNTTINKSPTGTGKIVITLNGLDAAKARYFWFLVRGRRLWSYFGYAEGFSIRDIEVTGWIEQTSSTPGTPGTQVVNEETVDIWALASVTASDIISGINITKPITKGYTTGGFPLNAVVNSLTIGCESTGVITGGSPFPDGNMLRPTIATPIKVDPLTYTGTKVQTYYDGKVSFDFTQKPVKVTLKSAALNKVTDNGVTVSSSTVSVATNANNVTAQTSSVYYSSSGVHMSTPVSLATGYRLRRVDGYIYPSQTNTVDVNDGILLLCDAAGNPFGFPTAQNIATNINLLSSSLLAEIDWRYGNLSVTSLLSNDDGIVYGFYDKNKLEFIGQVIPYIDYAARGPQNVFIAVCAIDADGKTQTKNEYIGPRTSSVFKPVNLPLKMVAPVYSVKMNRATSIRVGEIDPNISKFDIWELPVSSGSFWKKVNISFSRGWSDWKKNYLGQDLTAFYSTLDEMNTSWSKIYGNGYYDVIDENPIIVDDRTIQLRRIPLMNRWYPTSNLNTKAGIIKQDLSVYTRATIDSPWVQVSNKSIRDINSNNGIVKFTTRAVPSDKNLIKVSYVTASKDALLRQIDGKPIPLNPLLNSDIIDFDSPLYIYLLPKAIYKNSGPNTPAVGGGVNLARVTEYSKTSVVNFTYNAALFDSRSSQYDPFALPIAIVYVTNNPYRQLPEVQDIRVRGGGVLVDKSNAELQQTVLKVLSYWDVYPPQGEAYTKGGFVIIKIPAAVKNYFQDEKEIYQIITNNLTAGVAYELQDTDGNSWT